MLKRQKPTEPPARFKAKSMSSLFESVRSVCDRDLIEQSQFGGGGGFMPKRGGGAFGSPSTTNPTGKAGSKSTFSRRDDPTAFARYGIGIPLLADTIGSAMTSADQFGLGAFGEKALLGLIAGGYGLSSLFGAGKGPANKPSETYKFRGTGGFKGI